jgi:hypothetical protein
LTGAADQIENSPVKLASLIRAMAMQHPRLILLWFTVAFCLYVPPASAEKVVVCYPSRSLTSFLIPEIARQKGFCLVEGIEANLIYVRGAIDIKALVTGVSKKDQEAGETVRGREKVKIVP